MRSTVVISALISGALAFNTKICQGAGGCVQTTDGSSDPYRCPDGSVLNVQQTASNILDATNGSYEIVSKAQFPSSCATGAKPADGDVLVVCSWPKTSWNQFEDPLLNAVQVHTTQFNQKYYAILKETCTQKAPIAQDCYTQNPNPSRSVHLGPVRLFQTNMGPQFDHLQPGWF